MIVFLVSMNPESPGGFRFYKSAADRKRAIAMLRRQGFDYFSSYRDAGEHGHPFALTYGLSAPKRKKMTEEELASFRTPKHFRPRKEGSLRNLP